MKPRLQQKQLWRTPTRGFTIIELLVVISIITVIIAFSAPAIFGFLQRGEEARVRSILNGLASAADSYNITTGQTVDHKITRDDFGNNVDLDIDNDDDDFTFGWFVLNAGQVPESSQLIAIASGEDLTFDGDDMGSVADAVNGLPVGDISRIELRDTWDTPIRYAGGVSHSDSFDEDNYLRAHPTAFFVSAGPDGLFGAVIENTNEPDPAVDEDDDGAADAADNIYSFDLN